MTAVKNEAGLNRPEIHVTHGKSVGVVVQSFNCSNLRFRLLSQLVRPRMDG